MKNLSELTERQRAEELLFIAAPDLLKAVILLLAHGNSRHQDSRKVARNAAIEALTKAGVPLATAKKWEQAHGG